MKIGVFDSGLGGMIITKAFISKLPEYDYFYFGDTKNLPYGDKSDSEILEYSLDAIKFLIKQDCKLIIIACNTASSVALRYIQQKFIPEYAPEVKVLGVTVPTVEEAIDCSSKKIGVVATNSTISSHIYEIEIQKINKEIEVEEVATSELVPLIEKGDFFAADKQILEYSKNFKDIDSLILGCTHYPLVKELFSKHFKNVNIISQDDFMGGKLEEYLKNHSEIKANLTKNYQRNFFFQKILRGIKKQLLRL